jgi:polar amino acid transport system substrate-binding protein
VLKPTEKYRTYNDTVELFTALQAKQVNAVLIDMPVALAATAQSNGKMKTVAEIEEVGGEVGIIMEPGTPNKQAVDQIIEEMKSNGTFDQLEKQYYHEAWGGVDPETLPNFG